MQVVVLDASMTRAWCFLDEQTTYTERIFSLVEKCPLASLDKAMIRVATALDVEILQPADSFLQ